MKLINGILDPNDQDSMNHFNPIWNGPVYSFNLRGKTEILQRDKANLLLLNHDIDSFSLLHVSQKTRAMIVLPNTNTTAV